ncbi:Ribonuclease T2 [Tyrophagus putrescentiae]|nr:Ribonuclease T2 [Tyrophagus putrescentiae]
MKGTRLILVENAAKIRQAESDQELINALPKENEIESRKWTTSLPPVPEERAEVDNRKWTTSLPPIPEERAEVDVKKWTTSLPPIPEERFEIEGKKWTTKLPPISEERIEIEAKKWTTKLPPIPEEKAEVEAKKWTTSFLPISESKLIDAEIQTSESVSISPTPVQEVTVVTESVTTSQTDKKVKETDKPEKLPEITEESEVEESPQSPIHHFLRLQTEASAPAEPPKPKPKPKPKPAPKPKPTKKASRTPRPTKPHRTTRPHTRKPTTPRRPKTTRHPQTTRRPHTTPHHRTTSHHTTRAPHTTKLPHTTSHHTTSHHTTFHPKTTSHPRTTPAPHTTTSKPYPTPKPSAHHPMVLALQWPITFGKNKPNGVDRSKLVKQWTMHGVWPDSVSKCNPAYPFNETELDSIKSDLQTLWPNFNMGKPDSDFWKHEWVEHGTCTGWTIEGYFSKGKELWNRYPVTRWLDSAGIVPSNDPAKTYTLAEIEAALHKELSTTDSVAVNCLKKQVKGGAWESWLWEVYICLDHTGDVLHKCAKGSNKSNCVDPIHYYESF